MLYGDASQLSTYVNFGQTKTCLLALIPSAKNFFLQQLVEWLQNCAEVLQEIVVVIHHTQVASQF